MPRKPNPELKKLAMKLFDEKYSASQILDKLDEEARKTLRAKLESQYSGKELEKKLEEELKKWHLPTCEDTLYDWKKEFKKKAEETKRELIHIIWDGGEASTPSPDTMSGERAQEGPGQADKRVRTKTEIKERVEAVPLEPPEQRKTDWEPFPEEPSLSDLTDRNIPRRDSLSLLGELDEARHDGDFHRLNVVRKIVELRQEFPSIPLNVARSIARAEEGGEGDSREVRELAKLCRRYRYWEGEENRQQLISVAKHLGVWDLSSEEETKLLGRKPVSTRK